MNTNDTPRTDAVIEEYSLTTHTELDTAIVDLARKLERELNEASIFKFVASLACENHHTEDFNVLNTCPVCLWHVHINTCQERDEAISQANIFVEHLEHEIKLWKECIVKLAYHTKRDNDITF